MILDQNNKLKALVSTIEPIDGGVPSMTRWLCSLLEENDISPTLAWYAPWRNYPDLSVPLYKSLFKKPGLIEQEYLGKYKSYGIGTWYPEFEFSHYLPWKHWKELIYSNDLHIVVSGNALAASPYIFLRIPFMAWIATPWEADRRNRVLSFSRPRRLFDSVINRPFLGILERKILGSPLAEIISLSRYTSKELSKISGNNINNVMLMPVDTEVFKPNPERLKPWKLGFSGRYSDPRKNINLLLETLKILIEANIGVKLVLVGDKDSRLIKKDIIRYNLSDHVTCYGHMEPQDLSPLLQTLDVFVIPSHQEGLCIAALEAMASGVPVVSTRCGGPEEYVIPGRTGKLVDHSPDCMAKAIFDICTNREERRRLSRQSVNWVNENASRDASRKVFHTHLSHLLNRQNLGKYTKDVQDELVF